ncbi:SGNH/GDSL hydrolase family protein [Curtobacterium aetherium]|uniref:SGNH/GDSL hydrolase family protein n=1 Tax=Curtobacterium aetherium TaxID=2841594 RepID=A0ACD1E6S4_9MICO|nr:SGNH/GDSL hydrolase family protein [Curtobacterium sp. L6-1]QWS34580.1 SGNH/GDSL hydrolase family protein [Curtobacterium sp. L6-1]
MSTALVASVLLVGGVLAGGPVGTPGAPEAAVAAPQWPVPQPFPVPDDPSETLADLPPGSEYVALGDSYSAGYGLRHPTGLPVAACAQSGEDFPHRVAARFGLDLTDVTCAGATSEDVRDRTQFRGAPPQVEALSRSTRLVTLTIGGNDADLFGTAASCLALSASGPVFSGRNAPSCRSTLVRDGLDTLDAKIQGRVALGIAETLADVRRAAPNAEVVLLGYPAIFPDAEHTPATGCFRAAVDLGTLAGQFPGDTYPFTDTDVRWLHGVQEQLDQVGRDAARAAGVTFVDVFADTQAHSACARRDAYVEGISLDSLGGFSQIDLQPGALHPNHTGVRYLTDRTSDVLRRAFD